jgi:hypothetical protein
VNCCNQQDIIKQAVKVSSIKELLAFDEIIITGGEPMLIPNELALFLHNLRRNHGYTGKIYLYTALYNKKLQPEYMDLMNYINGIHFTIHYEAADQEIMELKQLSELLQKIRDSSFRLSIDTRLYEKYDFYNIDLSAWSVVRRMKWLDNCQLPDDEKLLIYELKGSELF